MNAAHADAPPLELDAASLRIRGLQRSEHRLLLTVGDAVCGIAAVLLALRAWSITTGLSFDAGFLERSLAWLILVPAWIVLLTGSRRLPAALSLQSTIASVFTAAALLLVLYTAVYFYAPPRTLPRLPAIYFFWEVILWTLGWRLVYLHVFTGSTFRRRAVVVGTGPAAARIVGLLRDLSPDVEVVASIGGHDPGFGVPHYLPVDLPLAIGSFGASEVIVAGDALAPDLVQDLIRQQERGVAVVPMAAEYEHLLMRVPVAFLPHGWMFTSLSEWVRTRDASNAIKRLVDIIGALAGLVLLIAVLPVVAVLTWIDSGRPLSYRQRRVGAGGREFDVVKFRSMVRDAEDEGPKWAGQDDPRVTRVGRWLRRSRLDELPQVLNVLRGDMSLVGPRPERPEFVAQLECIVPVYRARLMVRPGLTGWAQINADYAASADDAALKLEYDLYYIKHRSFLFDLWILVRTIATLLQFRGR
jgi:exopolysaccharide biosynthesis polyprenyl glycosylphosphotransferase